MSLLCCSACQSGWERGCMCHVSCVVPSIFCINHNLYLQLNFPLSHAHCFCPCQSFCYWIYWIDFGVMYWNWCDFWIIQIKYFFANYAVKWFSEVGLWELQITNLIIMKSNLQKGDHIYIQVEINIHGQCQYSNQFILMVLRERIYHYQFLKQLSAGMYPLQRKHLQLLSRVFILFMCIKWVPIWSWNMIFWIFWWELIKAVIGGWRQQHNVHVHRLHRQMLQFIAFHSSETTKESANKCVPAFFYAYNECICNFAYNMLY